MLRTRYRRILWFFAGVIGHLIWWDVVLPHIGFGGLSRRTRAQRLKRIAASFRKLAIQMGGVLIKVGQFLSARLDVLPDEITDELSGLQDEVEPESFANVRMVIEQQFGRPLEEVYDFFEVSPLASASIGQVHRARLFPSAEDREAETVPPPVVVKVQRAHIEEIVATDLSALRVVGRWIQRYPPVRRRADVPALLEEFSRSLYEETDYLHEGRNAEIFAKNFAGCDEVEVPAVYWEETTQRVLTLEDVYSIKITDYADIEAAGINRSQVAHRLVDTYLKQIFEDHFFHADPHPGNLFVMPVKPAYEGAQPGWKLIFVDFGMTGEIGPKLLQGLRDALIAVATRDPNRLIHSYQELGILLPGANIELLQRATAEVFERFWGKTTTEIIQQGREQMVEVAQDFKELLYEMPFQLPENMILLGRCLSILNGICTGLDPNFDIWQHLVPYAQKLVESEQGGRWSFLLGEVGSTLSALVTLPRRADSLMARMESGRMEVRIPELSQQIIHLEHTLRRLVWAVMFAAMLIGSIYLYRSGDLVPAIIIGVATFFTFLWLIFRR